MTLLFFFKIYTLLIYLWAIRHFQHDKNYKPELEYVSMLNRQNYYYYDSITCYEAFSVRLVTPFLPVSLAGGAPPLLGDAVYLL